MSGRSRYGGIFSSISQRDLNTVRSAEAFLLNDDDFLGDTGETITSYQENEYPGLEGLTRPELIKVIKLYKGYMDETSRMPAQSLEHAEYIIPHRLWSSKLGHVLQKLERSKKQ